MYRDMAAFLTPGSCALPGATPTHLQPGPGPSPAPGHTLGQLEMSSTILTTEKRAQKRGGDPHRDGGQRRKEGTGKNQQLIAPRRGVFKGEVSLKQEWRRAREENGGRELDFTGLDRIPHAETLSSWNSPASEKQLGVC